MTAGIFCLEGDWSANLARGSTVEPILTLLHRWDPFFVPYIHRNVSTKDGLAQYLRRWVTKRYKRFPILYIACHGTPGVICLDDACRTDFQVSLDFLEFHLEGKCEGRVICFGACGTLKTSPTRLQRFLHRTRAVAVCGYSGDVDWLTSTALELLVLGSMQQEPMSTAGMRRVVRRVRAGAGGVARKLGFRMVVRAGAKKPVGTSKPPRRTTGPR